MDERAYLSVDEVATVTGLSRDFLNRLRILNRNDGPPFMRVGRRCLYPRAALQAWTNDRIKQTMGSASLAEAC